MVVRWSLLCSLGLSLCACDEAKPGIPEITDAGDPCAQAHPQASAGGDCDAAPTDAGAPDPRDAGGDAESDAGAKPVAACDKAGSRANAAAAFDLCVWADPTELQEIHKSPEQRREIAATVTLAGEHYDGVQLELHGGSARTWKKKSYRVRFPDQRPSYDFFRDGAEEVERLVLQAAWVDPSFVRNKLVFDVLRQLGALTPRVSHARLYLNGELQGLYQVIERVDEHFLERHALSREGNLYKAESHYANFAMRDDPLEGFSERTHEDGMADDLADLFAAVANTERSHAAYQSEIETRLHRDDFELWNAVMSYVLNLDTFSKNYYLYRDPSASDPDYGSVFRIIHWDADTTFGLWWTGARYQKPEDAWLYGSRNRLSERMFEIPEYREPYVERLRELAAGPLSVEALWDRAEPLLEALEPDIRADLAQWERDTTYEEERAFLEDMIMLRAEVMAALLEDAVPPSDEDD